MRLIIQRDYDTLSQFAAAYIAQQINDFQPTAGNPYVLGLPTGSTPLGTYRELIELYRAGKVSFQNVVTFNMDEYRGMDSDHPQSYRTFMHENFFQHVDIRPENINLLDGSAPDPELECRRYEQKIASYGGIKLFLGGVGSDGHIAFNEPFSSLNSMTRIKTLTEETIAANARFFGGDTSIVPRESLTVGVATIMQSEQVLILCNGQSKAVALAKGVEEGVNHRWTISALQLHSKAIVVCDEDATVELRVGTYRYFKDIEKNNIL